MSNNFESYSIVIRGNEASEYYYDYCSPSWEEAGIELQRFDAVTPDRLKYENDLKFRDHLRMSKYIDKGIYDAHFTESEMACWYSHYKLWQESIYINKPILVTEHDALMIHPENFWQDSSKGIIFYDSAAMGSYMIQPWFAKKIVDYLYEDIIEGGPYSTIGYFHDWVMLPEDRGVLVRRDIKDWDECLKFKLCSRQVMSRKYGNTIEHYSDIMPDRDKYSFGVHDFLMIP